jgi:Predicted membrane protein|tara:strand:+ start:2035 stop:2421 length:387 start_codon:yes stop_codon:yes gene_type:complete
MHIIEAFGRIFLSTLFLFEGIRKFFYQEETIEYMEDFGVPEILFYPSLFFELVFPILLIIGFKTRVAASTMCLFTIVVSIIFHSDFTDHMQIVSFLKNLSIAGGFLIIASYEAKICTIDYYLKYKKTN